MNYAKNTSDLFAKTLGNLMAERGINQSQLASLVGVTRAAVSNYLKGRVPKLEILKKIANEFDVSIVELVPMPVSGESTSKDPGIKLNPFWANRSFGERLTFLRKRFGLSLQGFADKLGCNRSYIYKLQSGEVQNPSTSFVEKIVLEFQVSPGWLLFGVNDVLLQEINATDPEERPNVTSDDLASADEAYQKVDEVARWQARRRQVLLANLANVELKAANGKDPDASRALDELRTWMTEFEEANRRILDSLKELARERLDYEKRIYERNLFNQTVTVDEPIASKKAEESLYSAYRKKHKQGPVWGKISDEEPTDPS